MALMYKAANKLEVGDVIVLRDSPYAHVLRDELTILSLDVSQDGSGISVYCHNFVGGFQASESIEVIEQNEVVDLYVDGDSYSKITGNEGEFGARYLKVSILRYAAFTSGFSEVDVRHGGKIYKLSADTLYEGVFSLVDKE